MRLELSRFIESDLDDIADYIAQDSPSRAVTFIQDIRAKFHDIHQNPLYYQLPLISATKRAWPPLAAMPSSFVLAAR